MFENLSEKLERSFKVLKGQGKITEINVAETMKEVRRALLDADVNYKVEQGYEYITIVDFNTFSRLCKALFFFF